MKRIICLFLLLGFASIPCAANGTTGYTQFGVQNGLPSEHINSIVEDAQGNIWLGTDKGAARFDGSKFQVFSQQHGLTGNNIDRIHCDSDGKLWFLPKFADLCYYENGKFHPYGETSGISYYTASCLFEDKAGLRWIGTDRMGFYRSNKGNFSQFQNSSDPEWVRIGNDSEFFQSIAGFIETENEVCAVERNGFICMKGSATRFQAFSHKRPISKPLLLRLNNGQHLLTQQSYRDAGPQTKDIFILDGTAMKLLVNSNSKWIGSMSNPLAKRQIQNLAQDSKGGIYLGTDDGLIYFPTSELKPGSEKLYLDGMFVRAILADSKQNLWVATARNGLIKLAVGDSQNEFQENRDSSKGTAVSALELVNDTLWLGHEDLSVSSIANGVTKTHPVFLPNATGGSVRRISKGPKGQIWFATDGTSVSRMQQGRLDRFELDENFKALAWAQDGNLYLATQSRLLLDTPDELLRRYSTYKGPTFKQYLKDFQIYVDARVPVRSLYTQKEGTVWMGTTQTLLSYAGEDIIYWDEKDSIFAGYISDIGGIGDSIIYFSTYHNGVVIYNHQLDQYDHLTKADGLTSNICRFVQADKYGGFYIGVPYGLDYCIKTEGSWKTFHLDSRIGLKAEFVNAIVIDEDTVFAGTAEGLISIERSEMLAAGVDPEFEIVAIKVDGVKQDLNSKDLVIDAGNLITFELKNLNNRPGGANDFFYGLRSNGVEISSAEDQNVLGQDYVISFQNLTKGKHEISIHAFNINEETIGHVQILTFRVSSDFQYLLWSLGILIVIILGILWFLKRKRVV